MKKWLAILLTVLTLGVMISVFATVAFASSVTDNIGIKFADSENNVIKTATLSSEETIDLTGLNASVFSPSDGKAEVVEGWYANIGTEVSAEGLSHAELKLRGVEEITVYPKMSEECVIDTFAIYKRDDLGIARLCGNPSDYESMSSLKNAIQNAPDGAVVTLLYDKNTPYDIGGHTSISIPSGKTLDFDLNGRMLVQSYGATSGYSHYVFSVSEKTTFNVYSTAPGGAFYQARFNQQNQGNNVFAPGIIGISGTADTANINVGDIYDSEGNLTVDCADDFALYGGSLVFVCSSKNTGEEYPGKININVNGGYYYHSMRSGYALFTVQAPDVYINVNDAFVYNNNTTYAIVHDYAGGHMSISHFTAKNSEFICRNKDNTANTKFYYNMSEESTAYFENCVIMANTAQSKKGTITLGAGNIIAGDMLENSVISEGVLFGKQNEAVLERRVTHPPLYNLLTSDPAPIIQDKDGKWGINPIVFDKDEWVKDALKSCEISCGTYEPDGAKNSVKEVKWFNKEGIQVGESEYWVIGSKLIHRDFEVLSGEWYDIECSWCYEDGTLAGDVTLTQESVTEFHAKPQKPIGRINDKLANLTLSEHITFNLYLPIYSSVTLNSMTASCDEIKCEKIKMDGKDMYHVSWEMPYGSFDSNTVKLQYSVESFGEYESLGFAKSLECEIELDLLRYASIVAENSRCNSNESILMYEIVGYVSALAKFTPDFDENNVRGLEAFRLMYENKEKHFESACDCKNFYAEDIITSSDSTVRYSDLNQKGVQSIDYIFTKEEVGIRIFVKNSKVKIDSVTCTDPDENKIAIPYEFVSEGNYYLISGVSAMYIDNVFTINIGGASGTYSLARFIFDFTDQYLSDYAERDIFKVAAGLFEYARIADEYNK